MTLVSRPVRAAARRLVGHLDRDHELSDMLTAAQRQLLAATDPTDNRAVGEALRDYRHLAERRRQLAVEAGRAEATLTTAMRAAGFSAQQARTADVRALSAGRYEPLPEDR
jgi:hypothetical protein